MGEQQIPGVPEGYRLGERKNVWRDTAGGPAFITFQLEPVESPMQSEPVIEDQQKQQASEELIPKGYRLVKQIQRWCAGSGGPEYVSFRIEPIEQPKQYEFVVVIPGDVTDADARENIAGALRTMFSMLGGTVTVREKGGA